MGYYNNDWLYQDACDEYKRTAGIDKLEDDEKVFLKNFYDTKNDSQSKNIYYNAVFKLKRNNPKFFVSWCIKRTIKRYFIKQKAPKGLINASDIFAQKMLFDAIKQYCRISD